MYVLGVGIAGGMVLKRQAGTVATSAGNPAPLGYQEPAG
jgi:hypothetical protein